MRAFVCGKPNRNVVDVDLVLFVKRLLDQGDLLKRADFFGVIQQTQQRLLLFERPFASK